MIRSKAARVTLGAVGVAAMVWGFTGGNAPVSATSGADDVDVVVDAAKRLVASTGSSNAAAVAAASDRLSGTALAHPPGSSQKAMSAQAVDDPDGDGANEPSDADVNDNGVPDDQDPTIATFETVDGFVSLGIFEPTDEELRNVSHDAATRAAGNVTLPYGLLSYEVVNVHGDVAIILVWEKNASGATKLFKRSPSAVSEYPTPVFAEDEFSIGWGYGLVDGGSGDADAAVNGTITDPIGPGVASGSATTTTSTSTTSTTIASGSTSTTSTTTTPDSTTSTSTTSTTSTSTTSTTSTSTTIVTTPGDPDGDGAANEIGNFDVDGDGRSDDRDPTVAMFETSDGLVILAIGAESPGQLRSVRHDAVHSVGNVLTPHGLLSFDVVGATSTVRVVAVWERLDAPVVQLYKGSATALSPYPAVHDETEEAIAATYEIADGSSGDLDGVVNGVIVDPIAPGYVLASSATTGGGSTGDPSSTQGQGQVLARTGMSPLFPGAGITLVAIGGVLVAVAARPKGVHFR